MNEKMKSKVRKLGFEYDTLEDIADRTGERYPGISSAIENAYFELTQDDLFLVEVCLKSAIEFVHERISLKV